VKTKTKVVHSKSFYPPTLETLVGTHVSMFVYFVHLCRSKKKKRRELWDLSSQTNIKLMTIN